MASVRRSVYLYLVFCPLITHQPLQTASLLAALEARRPAGAFGAGQRLVRKDESGKPGSWRTFSWQIVSTAREKEGNLSDQWELLVGGK